MQGDRKFTGSIKGCSNLRQLTLQLACELHERFFPVASASKLEMICFKHCLRGRPSLDAFPNLKHLVADSLFEDLCDEIKEMQQKLTKFVGKVWLLPSSKVCKMFQSPCFAAIETLSFNIADVRLQNGTLVTSDPSNILSSISQLATLQHLEISVHGLQRHWFRYFSALRKLKTFKFVLTPYGKWQDRARLRISNIDLRNWIFYLFLKESFADFEKRPIVTVVSFPMIVLTGSDSHQ